MFSPHSDTVVKLIFNDKLEKKFFMRKYFQYRDFQRTMSYTKVVNVFSILFCPGCSD